MEVAMTRTVLRPAKLAMLSIAVLVALSLMSPPASAQAADEKDYNGELAILLLGGPSFPKGLTANGSPEPSTSRQFSRMIVKKLDKVRKAR
jgi:hypothetical protein